MLAAIATLYEPTGSSPMRDPLLTHLHHMIMCTHTTHPIKNGQVFDVRALCDLFLKWGNHLSLWQLCSKLLAMLCVLGMLHMATTTLPGLKDMNIKTINRMKSLKI